MLQSTIKNANFYFINPAGVTFGANAKVDVPAAFHVGTADALQFADGSQFSATDPTASILSIAEPASFGFVGTCSSKSRLVSINSAQLEQKTGQTLDVVAGNIMVLDKAKLSAPAGEIRLIAMQGEGSVSLEYTPDDTLPLPAEIPSATNTGKINVNASNIDTSGNGGGRIALWGGDANLTQSSAWADNKGTQNATSAKGVEIRAYTLNVDGSTISSDALGAGKSGNMTVETTASTHIANGGFVKTTTRASGTAGDVTVTADSLTIDRQNASGITGIFSQASSKRSVDADPVNFGNAGTVTVKAKTLDIVNGGVVLSSTLVPGDAGQVNVTADSLTINNSQNSPSLTGIVSINIGKDNSGKVMVKTGALEILNGGASFKFHLWSR